MQSQILVTGSEGFIGKYLTDELRVSKKYEIILTDRILSSTTPPGVKFIQCDLTSSADIEKLCKKIKEKITLVHLGYYVPKSYPDEDDWLKSIQVNMIGTMRLVEGLAKNISKICFISSIEVYGKPRYLPIDEDHPTEPLTFYGASKVAMENYLKVFSRRNVIPLIILRFASVYGPQEIFNRAIPNFIKAALSSQPIKIFGKGTEERDYIYIKDAARAIIRSIESDCSGVFNVGCGKGVSIRKVAQLVLKIMGKKSRIDYLPLKKEVFDLVLDIKKIKKFLNFQIKTNLEEGLRQECLWYNSLSKK